MSTALSPLEQLVQMGTQSQQTQPPSQSDLSPLEQLAMMKPGVTPGSPEDTGEITNDVGQKVIVPKAGEEFADTLKRAVTHYKSLSPDEQQAALSAEEKTIPKKAAQTLGAAAGIGVAGPATLATVGEGDSALYELAVRHLAGNVLPGMEGQAAKQVLAQAVPKVIQFAKTMGELGIGAGGIGYLIKTLMGEKK